MDSTLPDRKKTNGKIEYSDWLDVKAGVIQGSLLGLILFIIFISDINEYIPPSIDGGMYSICR